MLNREGKEAVPGAPEGRGGVVVMMNDEWWRITPHPLPLGGQKKHTIVAVSVGVAVPEGLGVAENG